MKKWTLALLMFFLSNCFVFNTMAEDAAPQASPVDVGCSKAKNEQECTDMKDSSKTLAKESLNCQWDGKNCLPPQSSPAGQGTGTCLSSTPDGKDAEVPIATKEAATPGTPGYKDGTKK